MDRNALSFDPIGVIHSPFKSGSGTPVQPRFARGGEGTVEVWPAYADALADLDGFDRIWLLFALDRARPWKSRVVPYRDRVPRGLFATRAPARPNPIGISCVRLLGVEGNILHVADLDILDGSPLIDIKPYVPVFDSYPDSRAGWLDAVGDNTEHADDRFHR